MLYTIYGLTHSFKLRLWSWLQLHCNVKNCEKIYLKQPQLPLQYSCRRHRNSNIAAAIAVTDRNLKP